jgi:DNA-binding winged helix-turn-helix (wHTH) protein/Tol biopolymer transport system component
VKYVQHWSSKAGVDYQFGPFRLDTTKRRLWRGDELVPLTTKAFETLLVLVMRAGAVVEKDDILKAVWPNTFVEEATLAQNISTLRKALGDTSETPTFIATVPRRGYRFLEPVTKGLERSRTPSSESPFSITGPALIGDRAPADVNTATATQQISVTSGKTRERFWMALSMALTLVLLVTIDFGTMRRSSPPAEPVAFTISPPEGHRFSTSGSFLAVSPDGRSIVFVATSAEGLDRLWIRAMGSPVEHPLAETEGASQPFWSQDSRVVGFFAGGKLKKVDVALDAVQTVCSVPEGSQPLGGTWNTSDDILFSSIRYGILRVPASGGTPTPLISKTGEQDSVLWPQFLPDGRHFLYVVGRGTRSDQAGIYMGALDSSDRTRVVAARSYAMYSPSGFLLFIQDGSLVAQPFDAVNNRVTGDPMPIADQAAFNLGSGRGTFSLSRNGVLAYRTVGDTALFWFDRAGKSLGSVGSVGPYLQFSVSPDNMRVAAARLDPQTGRSDIWIIDGTTGAERRLTFDGSRATRPVWSRDGSSIAFASARRGRQETYKKALSGNGPEERLVSSDTSVVLDDWSRDGRVLFHQWNLKPKGNFSLLAGGDATPVRLPYLALDESSGRISPDGRWLAYVGWEIGRGVYVRPLQSADSRWQIASSSGLEAEPRWRGDGRELFFLSSDLSLMAADIESVPAFRAGSARRLFRTQAVAPSGLTGQMAYDVTSDGQRFLVKVPASFSPITLVVNWTCGYRKLRPPVFVQSVHGAGADAACCRAP